MKIYMKYDVHEAALDRIRYIFDSFPEVTVGYSGGKDSTVIMRLALQVAREKNRLPLKVLYIDQEAEWQHVIDHIRDVKAEPDIDLWWFQMPLRMSNGTSHSTQWLHCWEEGKDDEWVREKEPDSIKENIYGTDRFAELFNKIIEHHFPDTEACLLGGVRAEESPSRTLALTVLHTWEHITYGKRLNRKKGHYTFYPIYDWSYKDIWKAIHDFDWPYCHIYDLMYQMGYGIREMRVSNLNHETAVRNLWFVQEVEPETWDKLAARLEGVNTAKHLTSDANSVPKELPEAFDSWLEYRDYLLENLIQVDDSREKLRKTFHRMDKQYEKMQHIKDMYRAHIRAILLNDYHLTTVKNWENKGDIVALRKYLTKGKLPVMKNKYVHG